MTIKLENIGKRFNKEWIFRNVSYEFSLGNKYSILGTNGTGKSTLLQIIAGAITQSEGSLTLTLSEREGTGTATLPPSGEVGCGLLSFAAPYLELAEEMTWKEAVKFHGKFKRFATTDNEQLTTDKVISLSGLESSGNKEIRNFSSGMKQRAKLSLAILSDTPLLLLDEPTTNLDENAVKWYQNLISEFAKEKLVIVCSNYNKEEYGFCTKQLVLK